MLLLDEIVSHEVLAVVEEEFLPHLDTFVGVDTDPVNRNSHWLFQLFQDFLQIYLLYTIAKGSVADPFHFYIDPDPAPNPT